MNDTTIMVIGLGVFSLASGMLGLGVAFGAVPFLGARITSLYARYLPGRRLKQMFGLLIVVMTTYRLNVLAF